jgi:hypothetical protein
MTRANGAWPKAIAFGAHYAPSDAAAPLFSMIQQAPDYLPGLGPVHRGAKRRYASFCTIWVTPLPAAFHHATGNGTHAEYQGMGLGRVLLMEGSGMGSMARALFHGFGQRILPQVGFVETPRYPWISTFRCECRDAAGARHSAARLPALNSRTRARTVPHPALSNPDYRQPSTTVGPGYCQVSTIEDENGVRPSAEPAAFTSSRVDLRRFRLQSWRHRRRWSWAGALACAVHRIGGSVLAASCAPTPDVLRWRCSDERCVSVAANAGRPRLRSIPAGQAVVGWRQAGGGLDRDQAPDQHRNPGRIGCASSLTPG